MVKKMIIPICTTLSCVKEHYKLKSKDIFSHLQNIHDLLVNIPVQMLRKTVNDVPKRLKKYEENVGACG